MQNHNLIQGIGYIVIYLNCIENIQLVTAYIYRAFKALWVLSNNKAIYGRHLVSKTKL